MLGALEQDVAVGGVTAPDGGADMLAAVRAITDNDLHPIVNQIDREGVYPDAVMRALGAAGAYSQHVGAEPRLDLATEAMAIAREDTSADGQRSARSFSTRRSTLRELST